MSSFTLRNWKRDQAVWILQRNRISHRKVVQKPGIVRLLNQEGASGWIGDAGIWCLNVVAPPLPEFCRFGFIKPMCNKLSRFWCRYLRDQTWIEGKGPARIAVSLGGRGRIRPPDEQGPHRARHIFRHSKQLITPSPVTTFNVNQLLWRGGSFRAVSSTPDSFFTIGHYEIPAEIQVIPIVVVELTKPGIEHIGGKLLSLILRQNACLECLSRRVGVTLLNPKSTIS